MKMKQLCSGMGAFLQGSRKRERRGALSDLKHRPLQQQQQHRRYRSLASYRGKLQEATLTADHDDPSGKAIPPVSSSSLPGNSRGKGRILAPKTRDLLQKYALHNPPPSKNTTTTTTTTLDQVPRRTSTRQTGVPDRINPRLWSQGHSSPQPQQALPKNRPPPPPVPAINRHPSSFLQCTMRIKARRVHYSACLACFFLLQIPNPDRIRC